jgi:hypothetical protein
MYLLKIFIQATVTTFISSSCLPTASAIFWLQDNSELQQQSEDSKPDDNLLRGKIVAGPSVELKGAKLNLLYLTIKNKYPQASSPDPNAFQTPPEIAIDESGLFEFARLHRSLLLYCKSPDGKYAGAAQPGFKNNTVEIRMSPTATVQGRLVNRDTRKPIPNVPVTASIHFHDPEGIVQQSQLIGATARTDAKGFFEIGGLVADQQYDLAFLDRGKRDFVVCYPLGTITTLTSESLDLGEVDFARALFSYDMTPKRQFEKAVSRAATTKQNLLVIFTSPGDPFLREFLRLKEGSEDFGKIMEHYQLLAIDCSGSQFQDASLLADELGIQLDNSEANSRFCVFDVKGKLLNEIVSRSDNGDMLPREPLLDLLCNNIPQSPNSLELYNAALQSAEAEGKLVLLQVSGPNCGPCQSMHTFLEATRTQWSKDFVWLELDQRWPATETITDRLATKKLDMIPWYAILGCDGNVLATSIDQSGKSMGFPGSAKSRSYFRDLIAKHGTRMNDEDLSTMFAELDK